MRTVSKMTVGGALAASAVLAMASPAASTVWRLHDVTMSGGTSLNGTFATDPVNGDLEAYDITVNGGPYGVGGGYLFTNTIADYIIDGGPQQFEVGNFGPSDIIWSLADSLAGRLADTDVSTSSFFCEACGDYFVDGASGYIAAPEAATWALMILGLGLMGGGLRLARARHASA